MQADTKAPWLSRSLFTLGYQEDIGDLGEKLGKAMFFLNCCSIDERYGEGEAANWRVGEDEQFFDYVFTHIIATPTPIQAYKSLQCFLYQSCEGICDKTPLYTTLREVQHDLADYIIMNTEEYNKAIWG
jgi:hypothetical protein